LVLYLPRDNGFSQYLLSLLRAAVHPTDNWAIGHLKMCPFMEGDSDSLDTILEEVRTKVYESGFASFVRQWGEQALGEVDQEAKPFVRKRLEEILTIANLLTKMGVGILTFLSILPVGQKHQRGQWNRVSGQ
jgi:hypothetical protein